MEKFSELLATLDRGKVDEAITTEITAMSKALAAFDGKRQKASGKVSLTVKFSVENGMVTITPTFTVTAPRQPVGVGLRFLGKGGELSPNDPRQIDAFSEEMPVERTLGVVRGGEAGR